MHPECVFELNYYFELTESLQLSVNIIGIANTQKKYTYQMVAGMSSPEGIQAHYLGM